MKSVDLAGLAFESTTGAPVVILREHDAPHRMLPIFIAGPEAAAIAAASDDAAPRLLTHDLMAALVQTLEGRIDAVEVTELRDGAFHARMAVHGPTGRQQLDTRPSDAIALAVRLGVPLFVSEAVLDEAGTLPIEEPAEPPDEEAIDDAVDEFRSFLDDIDPSQFVEGHDARDDDIGA
jgi:uncharacterized protein